MKDFSINVRRIRNGYLVQAIDRSGSQWRSTNPTYAKDQADMEALVWTMLQTIDDLEYEIDGSDF